MVICNDHLQPQLLCQGNLADGGNAVVTGYNGLYPICRRSLNDMLVDAVTVPDPLWDHIVRTGSDPFESLI